jgi:hypothetical protein
LNYTKGEFLYNGLFHEDGTFTANSNINDFLVYNLSGESINLGQHGFGPNSSFSFGIEPKNMKKYEMDFM